MANKHFFISGNVSTEKYRTRGVPVPVKPLPIRDRASHSATLLQKFDVIRAERDRLNQQREADQIATREGTYLLFSSQANHELISKSLESIGKGIRLLNIQEISVTNSDDIRVQAIVYVPKGKESYFIGKIEDYQSENKTIVQFHDRQHLDAITTFKTSRKQNKIFADCVARNSCTRHCTLHYSEKYG